MTKYFTDVHLNQQDSIPATSSLETVCASVSVITTRCHYLRGFPGLMFRGGGRFLGLMSGGGGGEGDRYVGLMSRGGGTHHVTIP